MRAYGQKSSQSQQQALPERYQPARHTVENQAARQFQTEHAKPGDSGHSLAPPIVHKVLSTPGQPLDMGTRAFMEPRFGHDFSRVRVHTDARAVESADALHARAYTLGAEIVFGQGEYLPATEQGRGLLAHELAHVAQQRDSGDAIQTMAEIGDPSDSAEHEAETVASAALSTSHAAQPQHAAFPFSPPQAMQSAARPVLRRFAKSSWAGEFRVEDKEYKVNYDDIPATKQVHPYASIRIEFEPNQTVEAKKIAFVQTANTTVNGQPHPLNTIVQSRSIQAGEPGEGTHIDAYHTSRTPLYGTKNPSSGNDLAQSQESNLASYGSGEIEKNKYVAGIAQMADRAELTVGVQDEADMYLESSAMAVEGAQKGVYYGAIKWGWKKEKGVKAPQAVNLDLVSQDAPSSSVFQKLGSLWDASKTSAGESAIHLPTIKSMYTKKKVKLADDPAKPKKGIDINDNIHVEVTERADSAHKDWSNVIVTEGENAGKMGWVMDADLTAQKPIPGKKKGAK
ncbi:MAG: DUF4157 domain-containing protein [Pyrinomonadaceae bacterium]